MVKHSEDRKRARSGEKFEKSDGARNTNSRGMTLSRKLRKKLNDSKEGTDSKKSQGSSHVKRRKRNYETVLKESDRTSEDEFDYNKNSLKLGSERLETVTFKKLSNSKAGKEQNETDDIKTCSTKFADKSLSNLDPFQRELAVNGLGQRDKVPEIKAYNMCAGKSKNILHFFQQFTFGNRCRLQLQKSVTKPVVDLISNLQIYRTASPFDRRVTALEWHPTKPNILAAGSKGGDIILWDIDSVNKNKQVTGAGAGGSCQAMKFWPWDSDRVLKASIDGTVTLHDFEGRQDQILADTMNSYDHWYCSVDVSPSRYLVAAGRNNGIVRLMSTEGREVFEFRLHKNKVTHVEFSPREDWLLCTASTDLTVQLWDVRMMKDRKSSLAVLKHERPVNSAYFSNTDGCRLLTTDQHNEIRVYRSPSWHLERTVLHPHRFFRHITPYKATWHPLQDLIVVGRYPDKNFPGYKHNELRTVDIIDADSGETVYQMYDPGAEGLMSLNKFNWQGDALASGMGFHVLLWNRKELLEAKQAAVKNGLMEFMSGSLPRPGSTSNSRSRPRPRNQGKEKKTKDTKTKTPKTKSTTEEKLTKVKLKTKTTKK